MNAPVLGVSAFFHNAAAAVARGGAIVAALEEERETRIKNDAAWPERAIAACLERAQCYGKDLECVAFYERPLHRLWRERGASAPPVGSAALAATSELIGRVRKLSCTAPIYFFPHHLSHAASAFLPSGFETAAVIVVDGVGEETCASIWRASPDEITCLRRDCYPHSFGLVYSYLTDYLGFKALQDEYKVMGLAAWGEPCLVDALQRIVCFDAGGVVRVAPEWRHSVLSGAPHRDGLDVALLGPRRNAGEPVEQRHMDLAASLQAVLTQWFATLVAAAKRLMPDESNLCLAGGVAHNCRAIGEIQERADFRRLFIQPAAGDAGGALGAALLPHFVRGGWSPPNSPFDPYLGPAYSRDDYKAALDEAGIASVELSETKLIARASRDLLAGKIIGWFQGRAEFGPRALGNRSILANPEADGVAEAVNLRIKQREAFRPFAPAVLMEKAEGYFSGRWLDRYMLVTGQTKRDHAKALRGVTHVDGSARVQLVDRDINPLFHRLIERFTADGGCPLLLNTSLNHSSEPMALSPKDALRTARLCNLDALALGPFYVEVTGG